MGLNTSSDFSQYHVYKKDCLESIKAVRLRVEKPFIIKFIDSQLFIQWMCNQRSQYKRKERIENKQMSNNTSVLDLFFQL